MRKTKEMETAAPLVNLVIEPMEYKPREPSPNSSPATYFFLLGKFNNAGQIACCEAGTSIRSQTNSHRVY